MLDSFRVRKGIPVTEASRQTMDVGDALAFAWVLVKTYVVIVHSPYPTVLPQGKKKLQRDACSTVVS